MPATATIADPATERYVTERERLHNRIDDLKTQIVESGREFSDDEKTTIKTWKDRIGEIDTILELIADDLSMSDEAKNRIAKVTRRSAPPSAYSRAGQVLFDLLHQSDGDSATRLRTAMSRAAEHMGTDAATTVPVAGDLGGLIVTPVVGAVIDPYPAGMPLATAIGLITAPAPGHFMRPRIDDPDFLTAVGPQGEGAQEGFQKAELPSHAFNVTADPVALQTVGTYLNISQQLVSFQPGSLDLIMTHQLKRLARAVESVIVTEMALSTATEPLPAGATSAQILAAIFNASADVYSTTGELASWIAMGPLGFARLGSLMDAAGRPLFPTLGAANAPGTASANEWIATVAGLRVIVTPAITDDSFWVGNSSVIEGYIYRFPVLEAVEPSVLGRQVAVAAAVAGYRPIANGAVHLTPAP